MDYLLIILFTAAYLKFYGSLGPLWSQILLIPGMYLAYSMGFGMLYKWRYIHKTEERLTFRILFVLYCVYELQAVYDAVKSALE